MEAEKINSYLCSVRCLLRRMKLKFHPLVQLLARKVIITVYRREDKKILIAKVVHSYTTKGAVTL